MATSEANSRGATALAAPSPGIPLLSVFAMVGSAACWGGATVMSRDLLSLQVPPPALLVLQLAASVIVLLLLAVPQRPWRHWSPTLGKASLIGVLEPGLTYSVSLVGLSLTSAGNASVISASEPVFIVFLAWLLHRQRPSLRLGLCIAIAVAGLLLVSMGSSDRHWQAHTLGDGLIVLSTLFAASYVVLSARYALHFPAAVMASAQQAVGLVLAVVLYLVLVWSGLSAPYAWFDGSPWVSAYAAASGVVQYALAFWLYLIGLRHLSPGAAGLWLTLVPVFGLAGAYAWLGEVPTPVMLTGALLIIAAVLAGRSEH